MTAKRPPPGLTEADFERIEEAVMETERGRWFLAEYARRIRAEGAEGMLAALTRIEDAVLWREGGFAGETARRLTAQAEAIEERLQDLAWRLREQKAEAACADVEAEIFALRALTHPPMIAPGGGFVAGSTQGELTQRLLSLERASRAGGASAQGNPPAFAEIPAARPVEIVEDRRHEAFAEIDALSLPERLAFFA